MSLTPSTAMPTRFKLRYPRRPDGKRAVNPSQRKFHHTSNKTGIVLFSGGVGSGKTLAGAFEASRLFWDNPGRSGWIVAHDWNTLENVTLDAFLSFLPEWAIIKHHAKRRMIECVGGRKVYYSSANPPKNLEAKNITWGWGDEIRYWKKVAYDKWIARKRVPGPRSRIVCTSTPSMGWIYDEFHTGKKNRGIIFCSSRENKANLGADFLSDLETSYDSRLVETYVDGQFKHLSGGVFEMFNINLHCRSQKDLYDPRLPVELGIDFGINSPAVLFFQHCRYCDRHRAENCIHFLDELIPEQAPTERLAPMIIEHAAEKEYRLGDAYVDPAGRARSQESGQTSIKILKEYGIKSRYTLTRRNTYIPNGIARMNAKLMPNKGRPSMYFARELELQKGRGIINAMRHSTYPTNAEGVNTSDQPKKDKVYEHIRDGARYVTMNVDPPTHSLVGTP